MGRPVIYKTGDSDYDCTHLLYQNEPLLKEFLKSQQKQILLDKIEEAKMQLELLEIDYLSDQIDRKKRLELINSWHTEAKRPEEEKTVSLSPDTEDGSIPIEEEVYQPAAVPIWLKQTDKLYTKLLTLVNLLETKSVQIDKAVLQTNCKRYIEELMEIDESIRQADYTWEGRDVYAEYSQRVDGVSELLTVVEGYITKGGA